MQTSAAPSLVALLARGSRAPPNTSLVLEDASNLASLPADQQALVRSRALRSILSIPICTAPPSPSATSTLLINHHHHHLRPPSSGHVSGPNAVSGAAVSASQGASNVPVGLPPPGASTLGCLTFGSQDPIVWEDERWFPGLQLLIAWTSGVLSRQRSTNSLGEMKDRRVSL